MKVTKLYTEAGFGFYLKSLTTTEFCELSGAELPRFDNRLSASINANEYMRVDAVKLRLRDDYDQKMLEPLTDGMFINPHNRPFHIRAKSYSLDRTRFEIGEKRIIFNCTKFDAHNYTWGVILSEEYKIVKYQDWYIVSSFENNSAAVRTLHELAEATKGQLNSNLEF